MYNWFEKIYRSDTKETEGKEIIEVKSEGNIQNQKYQSVESIETIGFQGHGFFKCESNRCANVDKYWECAKVGKYWERAKPAVGLASNWPGTLGDITGVAQIISRIPTAPSAASRNLLIVTGIVVVLITFCETIVEYGANKNHNSQTVHDNESSNANEDSSLNDQQKKDGWTPLRFLSLLIAMGAWLGYAIGATITAIIKIDKRFYYKEADLAVTLMAAIIFVFNIFTTYADIRTKYKNLNYYLGLTSEKEDDEADIWTWINPLSNVAMIYGHTIFWRDIFIALIAIFSPEISAGVVAYWLTMALGALVGGLAAVILTGCDFIQNRNLQNDKPTVGNHNVELNTKGKILEGSVRVHYATESGAPALLGFQKILELLGLAMIAKNPIVTMGVWICIMVLSLATTAADTDTQTGELKKVNTFCK